MIVSLLTLNMHNCNLGIYYVLIKSLLHPRIYVYPTSVDPCLILHLEGTMLYKHKTTILYQC
jgi:hypothetical protein